MKHFEPPHGTFTNLRKVDWDSYTREAEETFALLELPSSSSMSEKMFWKILNTSAKHRIPQGHILNMIPNVTEIAKRLIKRDALRFSSLFDLHIQELNAQIHRTISSNR